MIGIYFSVNANTIITPNVIATIVKYKFFLLLILSLGFILDIRRSPGLRVSRPCLGGEVPGADHTDIPLVAEHPIEEVPKAKSRPRSARAQAIERRGPSGSGHARRGRRRLRLRCLPDNPVGAAAHVHGRFSARDLTVPDRPSGRLKLNLGCGSPLVETVVPFPKVILRPGDVPVSHEAARLPGTGKRTRQDAGKAPASEPPAERDRLPFAGGRKGCIRAPGVPSLRLQSVSPCRTIQMSGLRSSIAFRRGAACPIGRCRDSSVSPTALNVPRE